MEKLLPRDLLETFLEIKMLVKAFKNIESVDMLVKKIYSCRTLKLFILTIDIP